MKEILDAFAATLPAEYAVKAKVHRYIPRVLNNAELPAFLILPTNATHRRPQADTEETSRLHLVRMYIAPLAQGIATELEEYAEAWVEDGRLFMNKRPRLENSKGEPLSDVYSAIVETDTGMVAAQYPINQPGAPDYLMIEWPWRVVTRKQGIS